MCSGGLVATAKALTVSLAEAGLNVRVAKLVAIVHVGSAAVVAIAAGALNAIMKSAALGLVQLGGRLIPRPFLAVSHGLDGGG
jgi:hypothetical protein